MAHGCGTSGAVRILFFATLLAALAGSLNSQTPTATLSGAVHDSSGAAVAKAKITLVSPATGLARTAETDEGPL